MDSETTAVSDSINHKELGKMLTEEELQSAEIIINNMGGCGVTLANDLISQVRTLQQQNKQQLEALESAKKYLESSPSWNEKKFTVYNKIEIAIQGGTQDGTSNNKS